MMNEKEASPMPAYEGYPLIPETANDGSAFGAITPIGQYPDRGAGFLQGPDGSRAGLQWELAETPFIMRLESPDTERWGVYRVGFTRPVTSVQDLVANLQAVLPKLRILYQRARGG
jgi:hypothetical protein